MVLFWDTHRTPRSFPQQRDWIGIRVAWVLGPVGMLGGIPIWFWVGWSVMAQAGADFPFPAWDQDGMDRIQRVRATTFRAALGTKEPRSTYSGSFVPSALRSEQ